jgi:predicted PurR-regulated permease PerM
MVIGFLLPLFFLGSSLAQSVTQFVKFVINAFKEGHGEPPARVSQLPVWMQTYIKDFWVTYMKSGQQMVQGFAQYGGPLSHQLITIGKKIGQGFVDLSLGLFISFFFFTYGARAVKRIGILLERFIGNRGVHLLNISKETLVSVVYGVLGTAVAQGAVAGIGFWIANVPGATFLGFVTVLMSLIPGGPPFVWIPVMVWLFIEGHIGMGIFMAVWGVVAISGIDNILRPYFISLGSDLPLLLVLFGVLCGLLAFGFIGLFIGPTLLALAYNLLLEWSHEEERRLEPGM